MYFVPSLLSWPVPGSEDMRPVSKPYNARALFRSVLLAVAKLVVLNIDSAGSFTAEVDNPIETWGTMRESTSQLVMRVHEKPNVRLWSPRCQLKLSSML